MKVGNTREIFLMGDFNARTGNKRNDNVVGPHGENTLNDNGERLINLCQNNKLKITNGFYCHKDIHKYTWNQTTRNLRSIIDYMIVKQNSQIPISDVRVMRGADCGSDHHLLKAKVIVPYGSNGSNEPGNTENKLEKIELPQYNLSSLTHESVSTLYKKRLDSKLDETLTNTSDMYTNIISSIHQAAVETLGIQPKKISHKPWWNEEVESAVTEKGKLYQKWLSTKSDEDKAQYNEIKKRTRRIISTAKNETWDRKCREIKIYIGGRKCTEAWKFINSVKNTVNEKVPLSPISPKEWTQYYKHLLNEDRDEFKENLNSSRIEIEGENIIIDIVRVKLAIAQMKNGRASGPEGVTAELLKNGSEKLCRMITKTFNEYINGHPTPDDWKTAYITSIYKKGDRGKCKNYRGISVTSTMSRLYGRILRDLIEEEYQPFEEEEQGGFRAGRSCTDNIFCLKQVIEKKVVTNREVHMTFVDLQKAYDTVPLNKIWEVLSTSNIQHTLIRALKDLYNGSNSRIKTGNFLAESFVVTKGLRQGCCISPTLFKIYISAALKQWKRKVKGMGIQLNEQECIYTLQFADDQVVISNDKDDMEFMMRKLIEEYKRWGLNVNIEKTKYLCIGSEAAQLDIGNNQQISSCDEYKYLGVFFDRTGKDEKEIRHRITQARRAIACLNGILWSKDITKKRKFNIYETLVKSSLLYGAETWRITEKYKKKIEATEMDAIRRSLRVSRAERIRNDVLKQQMGIEGTIVEDIERKQLIWYGHVSRMDDTRLPKKTLLWQPPERKKRGRPPQSWKLGVQKAISTRNLTEEQALHREEWRLGVGQRRKTL